MTTRIQRGEIGKVVLAQVLYYAGRPLKDTFTPGMDAGLKRLLHWVCDRELSGDIIVELNIHVIGIANYYLGAHPLKATGTGGRTEWSGTPYDTGNVWDRFAVNFWYPNDVHATFSSNQLTNSFSDLCVRCFGVRGCADTYYGGLVRIASDQKEEAWMGAQQGGTFTGDAITNVKDFIGSIRLGKPINNAAVAVESNFTGILGRMAACAQRTVTWDEMMASTEKWEVRLKLQW